MQLRIFHIYHKVVKTFEKTIEIAEDVARQILHAQKGKQVRQERIMYPMVIAA